MGQPHCEKEDVLMTNSISSLQDMLTLHMPPGQHIKKKEFANKTVFPLSLLQKCNLSIYTAALWLTANWLGSVYYDWFSG